MAVTALGCQSMSVLPFLALQRLEATRAIPRTGTSRPSVSLPIPEIQAPCQTFVFPFAL